MHLKGVSSRVSLLSSRLKIFTYLPFFSAATAYWTATNIADGLNALAICIEVRFSIDRLEPS